MTENISAYPLIWAIIYPRTPRHKRQKARFEVSLAVGRDQLLHDLQLLDAFAVTISSNVPLRQDGLPYASFKEPDDPGVAVYFKIKKKNYAMCSVGVGRRRHRWLKVKDNLRAIGLHIAARNGALGSGQCRASLYGISGITTTV